MSNNNENLPEIMTVEAYEYVKKGYIPHVKIGKQIRVVRKKLFETMGL